MSIVAHCCPDGGSEVFLAATRKGMPDHVLLVVWGTQETESTRRTFIEKWAKLVEE